MLYHSDQPPLNKQSQVASIIMDEALRKVVSKLDENGIKYNFFHDEIFIDPQSQEEMNMAMDILQGVFV